MAEVSPSTSIWDIITSGPVISGIVGLISGAIGSLIAPWSLWGVEKRRAKRQYRVEQIARWRDALRGDFDRRSFVSSEAYSTLKPYMPKRLVEEIEKSRNPFYFVALPKDNEDSMRAYLLEVVAEVERKWRLL
jgi:hypothetical protein